jgi:hypothetical protein
MKNLLKKYIKNIPQIRVLLNERNELRYEVEHLRKTFKEKEMEHITKAFKLFPPGHFYSPIPNICDIEENTERIWGNISIDLPGIDLNIDEQLKRLEEFKEYYKELPFCSERTDNLRYYFENPSYSYSDAIFLYCMIRKLKPKKIIEVGCGYSSCVMMDTNELFFNNEMELTFIDPFPERLFSLMKEDDKKRYCVLPNKAQECDVGIFSELQENDILFIDSLHVSKIDSDVNRLFFNILPGLNNGVHIHFHDIFYPFEYPKEWIFGGIAWNENYLLRAFLKYNNYFKIVFFGTFLVKYFREIFESDMPLCLKNTGGNIWIKKSSCDSKT